MQRDVYASLESLSSPPTATSSPSVAIDEDHPDAQITGFQCLTMISHRADFVQHPSKKIDYAENALIVTRVPNLPNEPGTEVVLHARAKRNIIATPGFPSPLPVQQGPTAFEIKQAGHKGLGMFATRDLQVGDIILVERALVIAPRAAILTGVPNCSAKLLEISEEMHPRSLMGVYEALMGVAFGRMSLDDKRAYLRLMNGWPNDKQSAKLSSISRTNAFEIGTFDDCDGEKKTAYSGVFNNMSRINHSCVPNSHRHFDRASFASYLRAGKIIAKGEEITISYHMELTNSTSARQEFLKTKYNINCSCPICGVPKEIQFLCDRFRASVQSRVEALLKKIEDINNHPNVPRGHRVFPDKELSMRLYKEAKSLSNEMEHWGMDVNGLYCRVLDTLTYVCTGLHVSGAGSRYRDEAFMLNKKVTALFLVLTGDELKA